MYGEKVKGQGQMIIKVLYLNRIRSVSSSSEESLQFADVVEN